MMRRRAVTLLVLMVGLRGLCGAENPVVEGDARFTVITPGCIRIEYAPEGKFIDAPSIFAVNRGARDSNFKVEKSGTTLNIDTGEIRLTYRADGQPLGPSNLSAEIWKDGALVGWAPGAEGSGNLGGTVTTLDMVWGPVDLGEGLLSRAGWYLLDDSHSPLLTDTWVKSRPAGSGTDWYLFGYGSDYKSAFRSLIAIGDRAPIPRRYAMGIWFSRYWKFSSSDYRDIVDQYRQHNFPLDVIVMDMDWHREGWTGWSWNKKLIPDPPGLLDWFHKEGLHVPLNLHPADGVAPHEDRYADFMRAQGEDPAKKETLPFDAGSEKYISAFLKEVLAPLQKDGVDFWWLDWQQYPFTHSIPDLTNLFWMNEVLFRSTQSHGDRGISLSRWAGWGDHRHPIQFSGDADTGWDMLSFEVPLTSTAGNVGCYYWSHDIGGHRGGRNEESYTRWVQFGATTAALRSHSENKPDTDRRPWMYPKWAENSMRIAFHLRSEILPYVYSSAWQTYQTGIPLNRPLYIEHPNLEPAYHNGQEFLLGDNLLVAPITMPGVGPGRIGRQMVWFPPGDNWFNVFTGEEYAGGEEHFVSADINEFPIYARGGAPIPLQVYKERPATALLDLLRVRCYPGAEGQTKSYQLYEDDGQSTDYLKEAFALTPMSYTRHGNHITIKVGPAKGRYRQQPAERGYEIELPNTQKAANVTINGKPAEAGFDPALGLNKITVPRLAIGEVLSVEADAPPAAAKQFAYAAQSRRIRGIVGDAQQRRPLPDLLSASSTGPSERAALLALGGIGLMPYHDSATFFGEERKLAFHAPAGVVDGETITRVDEEGNNGTYREKRTCLDLKPTYGGSPIFIDPRTYSRIEFKMGGRPYFVETPAVRKVGNLAMSATATASSTEDGHSAAAAIDGVADGYPKNAAAEWSASRQTKGARFQLAWTSPQTVREIRLYDRPNMADQVTSGRITFNDGTKIDVGALPNDGIEPLTLTIAPKKITSLTFEVTGVKQRTENAGLAEICVY